MKQILSITFMALLIISIIACNSSPTVPVPPPESIVVYPPNEEGFAMVEGKPAAVDIGDLVLVFNQNMGAGVVTGAEDDGSFSTRIEAEIGDTITVQVIRDDEVSEDETLKTVPPS